MSQAAGQSQSIDALKAQRARLQAIADDIKSVKQSASAFQAEGARYAGYAACWAAVLLAVDTIKVGVSAADKGADIGFAAIDKGVANANKVLQKLKLRTITTREDILKSLDGNAKGVVELTTHIRSAQNALKRAKINTPPEFQIILDLGLTMAEDTALILQAGQTQQAVQTTAASAQSQMQRNLDRVLAQIKHIDTELAKRTGQSLP